MSRKSNFLLLFLLLCLFACKKEKLTPLEQLPKETQEGKDTFGCLINGKAWVNSGKGGFTDDNLLAAYWKGEFFVRAAKLELDNNERMAIQVFGGVYSTGTYKLSMYPKQYATFRIVNNCEYQTDSLNTGILEITRLDTINFIASGRFSFTVSKPGCETVHITDGRFDVKYGN